MDANTQLHELLLQLQQTDDPAQQAVLIAEMTFGQLDELTAQAARRSIVLRWFDAKVIAALLPADSEGDRDALADRVLAQLAALPFVETLPWGWAYHEQTRAGLLKRYSATDADMLQKSAGAAAAVFMADAGAERQVEALYCLLVANRQVEAEELLDALLTAAGGMADWGRFGALFACVAEAERLEFVSPLKLKAHHYLGRGLARSEQGDLVGATSDFDLAIVRNAHNAMAYLNRGNLRRAQGDLAGAASDFDQAIALNPEYAMAYYNRGNLRRAQGDLLRAMGDYNLAIHLDPQNTMAYSNRGMVRRALGDLKGAVSDYDQVIALNPRDSRAYNNRGNAWRAQGELARAMSDYQLAIQLDPQNSVAYSNRGIVRRALGDFEGAVSDYDQAIALNPRDARFFHNRGNARRAQGDLDGAISDYDMAASLEPDDFFISLDRNLAKSEREQVAGAIRKGKRVIDLDVQYDKVYYNNRGLARRAHGDLAGAVSDYDRVIALNPQSATAYNNRGNARRAQGDLVSAMNDYDLAIALNPRDVTAYNNRGTVLRLLGRWEEAEITHRRATQLNPKSYLDWAGLGDLARRRGDTAAWLAAIAKGRPHVHEGNLYNAACFESIAGNVDHALMLLAKALVERPGMATWAALDPDLEWIRHNERFTELIRQRVGAAVVFIKQRQRQ